MTFDVYFLLKPHAPYRWEKYKIVCSLEDGYAMFFFRVLEQVNERSGKSIICDDWAFFGSEDLHLLSDSVAETYKRTRVKDQIWSVLMGKNGDGRDVYSKVNKTQMHSLLDKIKEAVTEARSTNTYVGFNFWGGGG